MTKRTLRLWLASALVLILAGCLPACSKKVTTVPVPPTPSVPMPNANATGSDQRQLASGTGGTATNDHGTSATQAAGRQGSKGSNSPTELLQVPSPMLSCTAVACTGLEGSWQVLAVNDHCIISYLFDAAKSVTQQTRCSDGIFSNVETHAGSYAPAAAAGSIDLNFEGDVCTGYVSSHETVKVQYVGGGKKQILLGGLTLGLVEITVSSAGTTPNSLVALFAAGGINQSVCFKMGNVRSFTKT